MISHKLKCIFIPVRRAAGQSICKILQEYCLEELNEHIDRQQFNLFNCGVLSTPPSVDVDFGDWYRDIEKFREYFVFTIVRNPWDRLLSGYFYSNRGKRYLGKRCWTLKKFIQNLPTKEMDYNWWFHITRTLTEMLVDRDGKYIADFTIRYENLKSDFAAVCDKLGIKGLKLPQIGKTSHKHYTKYYNDETRKMVEEIFAKDIEYFGYKFFS
jgi:hypothetical protein